jgi:signal transduction histidine kinase
MQLSTIRAHLLPHTETDPRFRDYLSRLSAPGIQTMATVEIVAALLLLLGRLAIGDSSAGVARLWQTTALVAAGCLTVASGLIPASRRYPRFAAAFSAWLACTMLYGTTVWRTAGSAGTEDYILTAVTLVIVTAAVTVPLLPWHAFVLGLSVEAVYIFSCLAAAKAGLATSLPHREAHDMFLILLTILATGIAASNYEHRRREFEITQESVRVAEALTGAQLRAQLAETAISIGKMSAALSHEINSPVGALRSAVETLIAISNPPENLVETRDALYRSIRESAARIDEVTRRLRRFVNLEEAELKSADINELLQDVTVLHEKELEERHIQLELDLQKSLPPLECRPQLLTAAFSILLSNAIQAVNGEGRIAIETHGRESDIEVTIRDNGRGMTPEEADTIFEPGFKVNGDRVSSANWSLFHSRQIVYEHGGEIRLDTAEGRGTAVHVTLPV